MSDLQKTANPLAQYFRQPKIYIKLPSNGNYYPESALDRSENGEYAVYAMTAKDELLFKTPDALLSGQSTVEVIKSCIPAIKDPWSMPSLDLDAVLVAIRIATYGEEMEVTANCPSCEAENNYAINLTNWLGQATNLEYKSVIDYNPLQIHIRPYTYQEITKTNLKTFEQQRIFAVINDEKLSDEEKINLFNDSFVKLTQLTVDVIAGCIDHIVTPDGNVSDQSMILEFLNNAPKDLFETISDHIGSMKTINELKPVDAQCTECNEDFTMPITMDQSNFFAKGS